MQTNLQDMTRISVEIHCWVQAGVAHIVGTDVPRSHSCLERRRHFWAEHRYMLFFYTVCHDNQLIAITLSKPDQFYHASYGSAVLAVIVCPSVRPSVTSRSCTKIAKLRITLATPYDGPGTLVFWCQNSQWNSNEIISNGAPNRGAVGSNRAISTREQLCGSDAVPRQICIPLRQSTPMTCLRWRSDIGLLLSTTSGRSRLRLLCLFQLTVCSHGSVCISRASCQNCFIIAKRRKW